jgi:hypothetical protein
MSPLNTLTSSRPPALVKAAAPAADAAAESGPAGRSPSVTGITVTGAVKAVGGPVTGAATALTRGRESCAGRDTDRHRAGRN